MSNIRPTQRDERTVAVENASYKWACTFLTFALFIDVMYRAVVRNEAAWDLLALVIVGAATSTVYQVCHKTLPPLKTAIIACVAGIIAAVIAAAVALWARS